MIVKFEELYAKQPETKHTIARKQVSRACYHTQLQIDAENRKVVCKICEQELDPIQALLVISDGIWWEQNTKERQLDLEEKKVKKVQYAAVEHLYRSGVTPEEYRIRWEKEDAKAKARARVTSITSAPEVTAQSDKTAS